MMFVSKTAIGAELLLDDGSVFAGVVYVRPAGESFA
jgi:hypothetical protein